MMFGFEFTPASGNGCEGPEERPRLAVFRSLNHIYAQVIDDRKGHTLAAASSGEKQIRAKKSAADERQDRSAAETSPAQSKWGNSSPSGPKRRASPKLYSIGADICTTGA